VKLPRLTFRARLALVYGGLVLLAGVALLGVTYVLVSNQLPRSDQVFKGCLTYNATPAPSPGPSSAPVRPYGPEQDCTDVPQGGQLFVKQFVDSTRDSALRTLLTQGGGALAVVCAVATAFAWLVAGRLLQPLHKMTETARRIADAPAADRGLHERISLDGPRDEVKELADTFDLMLARLDHSFDSQRRFIANASHELRTPLTLNRTLLEVALESSPEIRQLGETLLAVNTRHERLIEGLLLLARSERDVTERSYVDLADIVEHVAAQVPPGAVSIRTEPGEAPTEGNPVLLERLVQNLVENGVRYNIPEDGWVLVESATSSDGSAVLRVSNTGPVVPRYDIPSLFEPFHRHGADRLSTTSGAGLGLSIVRAVARAHGGTVHADPRDDGGLVVTVTLPPAPPD
jgi:signal transduction histidine kinase